MHRCLTTALAAVLWIVPPHANPALARSDVPGALDEASRRLRDHDARGAVHVLETALPDASPAERRALVDRLLDAYAAAARQAEAQGRTDEADAYRDDLDILARKPGRAPRAEPPGSPGDRAGSAAVQKTKAPAPPAKTASESSANMETPPVPLVAPAVPVEPAPDKSPEAPRLLRPAEAPAPPPARTREPRKPSAPGSTARDADAAFLAGAYEKAGQLYADLDRAKALPADRKGHWAYCRAAAVVAAINASPSSAKEWAAVDAEIQAIRALSPSNWFAEYLRNLASERHRSPRGGRPSRGDAVVVRANSPEEPPQPAPPAPAPSPAPAPDAASAIPPSGPVTQIPWSRQPLVTANFQVTFVEKDRALAVRVAQEAETAREAQVRRWGATLVSGTWEPKCEVVLFPNARDFSRETLQPPDSPGFSTMGMNAGRIVLRRVHLRADHPNVTKAVLPHEITHVVLADLFPQQQVPRWADEGMAVLAEPNAEQSVRVADLVEPLQEGRVFRISDLMTMDYPDAKHWSLYYAQSVSLTRFLVETGSPSQFLRFVRASQRDGFDPALREVYAISGFDDLQTRWLAYAREKGGDAAAVTASSDDPEKGPSAVRR